MISDETKTHYRVNPKRKNLLENVAGVVVHDHWKSYFQMQGVRHALCNAHHLRELKALEEIEKEPWSIEMGDFLSFLSRLKDPPWWLEQRYDDIINRGLEFHTSKVPLNGRKKRIGHNLLIRLRDFKEAVLRFMYEPGVPFSNNQAEQDVRMMKVKQKISGGFRTSKGADVFCSIRGFISTHRKQNLPIFQSILAAIS